jgi:hypothetical protein
MGIKDKVLRQLSQVLLLRDKPAGASKTVTTASPAGQKVVSMSDTTGFAANSIVRLGSGESLEVGVVASVQAGVSITMTDNIVFARAVGDAVVEQLAYDVGDVTSDGVALSGQAQTTDTMSAMRRLVYTILQGYLDLGATFALPTVTLENLAIALGIPFSAISGAGTAAQPFSLITDGSNTSTEANQSIIVLGVTMDGSVLRVEQYNAEFDFTSISLAFQRGVLAPVPVKVTASSMVLSTNASAFTATTTKKPTKGKVFDSPQEVGVFADATTGPLATTTTGAVAAGAYVWPLTSATNLVAGDWIRVGSGDTVEFHRVDSIAALNVTTKTPAFRAQVSGVSVVRQTQIPFAGIGQSGPKFEVSGSVEQIRSANSRTAVGQKPGSAVIKSTIPLIEFSLANFARALGIPQAQIVGGRLPAIGALIGTDIVQGVYTRGVLQDGTVHWTNYWGCSSDVSAFAAQFTNTGVPEIPFIVKPASGVHFMQHP